MKELIIKDLQKIAKQLEKTPTRTEYFKTTSLDISRKTLLKYFESYTDALTAAGLGKKPIYVNCDTCQEQLIRTKSTISKHNFCDHSCSAKFTNTLRKVYKVCKNCNNPLTKVENTYCNIQCQKDFEYNKYINDWKLRIKTWVYRIN